MSIDERFLVKNGILLDDEQDRQTLLALLEEDKLRRLDDRRALHQSADPDAVERELASELRRHRQRVLWTFRRRDLEVSLDELELSIRAYNTLRRNSIGTVGQILSHTRQEIRGLRNMGQKGFDDLQRRLADFAVRQLCEEWHRDPPASPGIG